MSSDEDTVHFSSERSYKRHAKENRRRGHWGGSPDLRVRRCSLDSSDEEVETKKKFQIRCPYKPREGIQEDHLRVRRCSLDSSDQDVKTKKKFRKSCSNNNNRSRSLASKSCPDQSSPPSFWMSNSLSSSRASPPKQDVDTWFHPHQLGTPKTTALAKREAKTKSKSKSKTKTKDEVSALKKQLEEQEILITALLETMKTPSQSSQVEEVKVQVKEKTLPQEDDNPNDCIVCMDAPKTHLVLPCGHLGYCKVCVQTLKVCSLCRGEVQGFNIVWK